jgi:HAD superfamily hydrolase (TIGR01490 family)
MNLTLFDLDGTLIPKDSDHAFGEFLIQHGWANADEFKRGNDKFYADYLAGTLDMTAYVEFATAPWRARAANELADVVAQFVKSVVQPMLMPAALNLVRQHQADGDLVAIVTATNDFITRPIADCFGVHELIATDLQRDAAGAVTGAIRGVPSFREGKVTRVERWLAKQGLVFEDFQRHTFYSDSSNDLPLMERVSHPVATNPGPALERVALDRGWPILKLFT